MERLAAGRRAKRGRAEPSLFWAACRPRERRLVRRRARCAGGCGPGGGSGRSRDLHDRALRLPHHPAPTRGPVRSAEPGRGSVVRSHGEPAVRSLGEGWAVMSESDGRRWAAMTAVAGTVFIAAGAFLSFTSLRSGCRSGIGRAGVGVAADRRHHRRRHLPSSLCRQRSAWHPALLVGGARVGDGERHSCRRCRDADVPRMPRPGRRGAARRCWPSRT